MLTNEEVETKLQVLERLWGLLKTATTRAVWEDLVEQRRPIAEALAEHFFPLVQRLAVSTNLLMVRSRWLRTHGTSMPELYAADKDFSDVWISDGLMLSVHFNGDGPGCAGSTHAKTFCQPAPLGVQVPPKPKPDDTHQE